MSDERDFNRLLTTCAAHFARYGKEGRAAPTTRSLECAFENYQDFSDAMAACLMKRAETSENLRRGLDAWKVFESDSWTDSAARFDGLTVAEIKATIFHNGNRITASSYRSEFTPAGEQMLMPGCEPDAPQTGTQQLNLF